MSTLSRKIYNTPIIAPKATPYIVLNSEYKNGVCKWVNVFTVDIVAIDPSINIY
ncbi:hypothetical protein H477_1218 [[Clostridium] sordellii ATCC 9714]|nr:hypothetical protein H477_1218 [[Clostridium] sordellii ATCC 9714] [Paeniclostridium sordellii ATCC 9714]